MKKTAVLLILLAFAVLASCGQKDAPLEVVTPEPTSSNISGGDIWTHDEMPVSVRYDRMWIYSAFAETDDPAVIAELVDAIKALDVGAVSEWVTEDYTDIIRFRFADGTEQRLEFENQCWVDGETRYEVEGLDTVRAVLDEILGDDSLS